MSAGITPDTVNTTRLLIRSALFDYQAHCLAECDGRDLLLDGAKTDVRSMLMASLGRTACERCDAPARSKPNRLDGSGGGWRARSDGQRIADRFCDHDEIQYPEMRKGEPGRIQKVDQHREQLDR